MKTVTTVQAVIDAVNDGAAAVYRDTYKDQMRPSYRVLETEQEADEFQRLVQQVEEAKSGTLQGAIKKLEEFVGDHWCLPSYLRPIYKDGRWLRDPESLLDEEAMNRLWEEDEEWFEAQREHFAEETADFVEVHCGTCGFRATIEKPLLEGVRVNHSIWCTGTLSF